jgi:hypothetical protein
MRALLCGIGGVNGWDWRYYRAKRAAGQVQEAWSTFPPAGRDVTTKAQRTQSGTKKGCGGREVAEHRWTGCTGYPDHGEGGVCPFLLMAPQRLQEKPVSPAGGRPGMRQTTAPRARSPANPTSWAFVSLCLCGKLAPGPRFSLPLPRSPRMLRQSKEIVGYLRHVPCGIVLLETEHKGQQVGRVQKEGGRQRGG